ncbi:thiamine-phosphate synthase [Spirochaetia bacterium]|nr:thiamine-phosphate synthase [Spirochaetia bacterium]
MNIDYSLYLVTDSDLCKEPLETAVEKAIAGGVTMVQLREKNADSRGFFNTAEKLRRITRGAGVPFIINDRVDIALACDADGVHVGQCDLDAGIVRRIIGGGKIVGVSVCSVEEAEAACRAGADYLGVGAMFETGTKTNAAICTIEELRRIRAAVPVPIVIIGGINSQTLPLFRGAGINGAAIVSAIIAADDIETAARKIKADVKKVLA